MLKKIYDANNHGVEDVAVIVEVGDLSDLSSMQQQKLIQLI